MHLTTSVLPAAVLLGGLALIGTIATGTPAQSEIRTQSRTFGDVPALICYRDDGTRKPLLLFLHGFSGAKEQWIEGGEAGAHAAQGYFVVAIDNRGHGVRKGERFDFAAIRASGTLDLLALRRAIKETADDIPGLIDALSLEPQVDTRRVALVGVSMGGFITFRAATLDPRITVASPLIASPYWEDIPRNVALQITDMDAVRAFAREHNPALHPERFAPCALLIQLGAADTHFDNAKVAAFAETLRPYYAAQPERLKFVSWPGRAHEFAPEMRAALADWLARFLPPAAAEVQAGRGPGESDLPAHR